MSLWNITLGSSRREVEYPSGCSRMVESRNTTFPGPCSLRMRYVKAQIEKEYKGAESYEYALTVRGYCEKHVPRDAAGRVSRDVIKLGEDLSKALVKRRREEYEYGPITLSRSSRSSSKYTFTR